ncbi:unnamed protein product [Chilo suppressalis]|uniref:Uncharacterized protein n=1 Tax=Chilo suppressalis TaxID=168631 RepID=A0ABN8BH71_CHISP|nr:unnamed protein product [Chilo suppressalis]
MVSKVPGLHGVGDRISMAQVVHKTSLHYRAELQALDISLLVLNIATENQRFTLGDTAQYKAEPRVPRSTVETKARSTNMARATIALILFNIFLLIAVTSSAPAEKQPVELQAAPAPEKADLVSATDDLKPAASHWGGHYGGWGGHYGGWGGHYGHYPYYGSYWGWPSYGYGYGYWPYGGYGGYGGFYGSGWW